MTVFRSSKHSVDTPFQLNQSTKIAQGTWAFGGGGRIRKVGLLKAHEFKYKFYALQCHAFLLHLPLHVYQFNLGASSLQSQVMGPARQGENRPTALPLPSEAFHTAQEVIFRGRMSQSVVDPVVFRVLVVCVWRIPQAVLFFHSHIDKFPHQPRQH